MWIFEWLNNQLLKMEWLFNGVEWFVVQVLNLDMATPIGGSDHFFIYDVIKIFILLSVLIFGITYIQTYFPPERTKRILSRYHGFTANTLGALLGTVTPFCSCSSIPIFIGFTNSGLPISVSFSFLLSSPLVDVASIILLASIFNWKIAIAYVLVGLILAVICGTIIGKMKMEKYIEAYVTESGVTELANQQRTRGERIRISKDQVLWIISQVWPYVLIGVGIGAGIHNWIPTEWVTGLLGSAHWYSVPLATLIGIPIYADIFGTLPIAEALVARGAGLGTVLSLMMGITALSLPSIIMLKKVVKPRLLGLFVGIVAIGIMIIGYLFNHFAYLLM